MTFAKRQQQWLFCSRLCQGPRAVRLIGFCVSGFTPQGSQAQPFQGKLAAQGIQIFFKLCPSVTDSVME